MSAIDFAAEPLLGSRDPNSEHALWVKRKDAARNHRRRFEKPWMEGQLFAAGKQWAEYNTRTHRVLVPDEKLERKQRTHDVLMQYVWTVVGALATDDFRPQFLTTRKGVEADDRADYVNKALAYGWEEEWDGDETARSILLYIVTYGTGAIRCRYDRSRGELLSSQMPYRNGEPILDSDERAKYMDSSFSNGAPVQMGQLREGQVTWEALTPWNLLPQPGIEHPRDFSWEIVVRPVPVEELRAQYPSATIRPEAIESMDVLGSQKQSDSGGGTGTLEDHALVYTGYEHPGPRNPEGQTVRFTSASLLGEPVPSLPYPAKGGRPASTGVTYFFYWPVPTRFWGRGFMEPGMGPQRSLNKRETQIDKIIDRGLPYVIVTESTHRKMKIPDGLPLEVVIVPDGTPVPQPEQGIGPGQWMGDDLERLKEAVSDSTGVKQVALGENPPNVGNYSQLALLKDSEATKLGIISQRFNNGMARVSNDSLAAMRNWPSDKKLLIVGPEDELEAMEWDKEKIPDEFLIRPAQKGAQPRGIGAELAKVTDLWNAAVTSGAILRNPVAWLDWYARSIEAGKAQPLPDEGEDVQRHKAALENLVMEQTGQVVPVAPYDNDELHVQEHDAKEEELSQSMLAGDQAAQAAVAAIEQHKQLHMQQAQSKQAPPGITAGQGTPSPPAPQLPPGATGAQPPPAPPAGPAATS